MAKRTKHNLSNYKLLTCKMGELVPVQLQEILPGDSVRLSTRALIRMAPMLAPVMHPIDVRIHHFFIPNRLTWPAGAQSGGWEAFITGDYQLSNAETVPTITLSETSGTLADYLGVQPDMENLEVNALPFYCYNLIFNEYYRDQDLDAGVGLTNTTLQHCAWEKDPFTAARPYSQKGLDEVSIPLQGLAPVVGGTDADLSQAPGQSPLDWRRAFALQRFSEARARYGGRFIEYLRYLGANPTDSRLQRPEYLGGGKATIQVSEVLQTGTATGGDPIGTLKGHGIAGVRTRSVTRHFQEHGYLMTLMSVRPKSIYTEGLDRHWFKQVREEYFQPELQNIGQQEVYKGEVFASTGLERQTLGWQDRYNEYTRCPSRVAGDFRYGLNHWHLARSFAIPPTLNKNFITCTPSSRIFADTSSDHLWCMVQHNVVARRLVRRNTHSRII